MYNAIDTDDNLLLGLQKGDQSAFKVLYERYWKEVYNMVYRRIRDEEATKDIVQNIFVNLWTSRKAVTIESTLAPYLNTAAKNRTISFYKKNLADFSRNSIFQDDQLQHSIEHNLEANELKAFFNKEIENMPDTMRKAFVLSREENKSIREIASELSLSEQTIKNNISQALERLKKKTKRFYSDPTNLAALFTIALTKL
ncbi:sigma-70 family RNA polymerase sigma factor [Pedobacter hiemivivus]|uniref:Sigma-70 family RNA polymerase sigma factor n=1 Tax=Pedobacter hiemivivus TaxID=2530454 RepID=A0A4U1GPJ3_9SPHI|nr:sigma-70 family RNA polymerase sigma factor [Pedobacter hiemivivus]TKC65449.1 sigma-70 family RNA polymerase sigma factor [Pedobacter hiemivivus]